MQDSNLRPPACEEEFGRVAVQFKTSGVLQANQGSGTSIRLDKHSYLK